MALSTDTPASLPNRQEPPREEQTPQESSNFTWKDRIDLAFRAIGLLSLALSYVALQPQSQRQFNTTLGVFAIILASLMIVGMTVRNWKQSSKLKADLKDLKEKLSKEEQSGIITQRDLEMKDKTINELTNEVEASKKRFNELPVQPLCRLHNLRQKCFVNIDDGNKYKKRLLNEIQEFETEISRANIRPISRSSYMDNATRQRAAAIAEVHVLYATQEAVLEYYNNVDKDWLFKEPESSKNRRRRIIVVDQTFIGNIAEYRESLTTIVSRCLKTSQVELIEEGLIKDRINESEDLTQSAFLLRDFGIFDVGTDAKVGFFTYVPFPYETDVFGFAPNRYYILTDRSRNYLDNVMRQFNSVWNDPNVVFETSKLLEAMNIPESER